MQPPLGNSVPHPVTTLGGLLAERARATGDGPFAFFSDGTPLTAADLLARAGGLAGRLAHAFGIKPGSRVAILAPIGPAALAALAACWQLGAIACPLEAFLHPRRFAQLVRLFRPDLVLLGPSLDAAGSFRAACAEAGSPALALDEAAADGPAPRVEVRGGDGALCIYTSGSTGNPKGVLLTHANLLAGAANVIAAKRLTSADRACCVLPPSHINGLVTTFLTPLACGGSVLYLQGPFEPRKALALIDQYECTWLSAVPTQYAALMRPPVERRHWSLASLRFCRSAAAPLSPRLLREFEAHYGVPVIETMGMTEAAGQIFSNPLPPTAHKPGAVGLPVGFAVRLVAEDGSVCGDHAVGEVQYRGPALMAGYLDDPEETARAFDGPWLKSGDLAERDAEGYYFIKGRKKDVAIFAGVNVSLRFLDNALRDSGLVLDAACAGKEHPVFGETVVAYAIPRPGDADPAATARAVTEVLAPLLPSRQALEAVRLVADFPRSGVGKVLKGRLGEVPVLYEGSRVLPRDARGLLAAVLNLPADLVHDGLALGLVQGWDSLGHAVLVFSVETVLGRQLTGDEVLALTSFKGLEAVLAGNPVPSASGCEPSDPARSRYHEELTAGMVSNRTLPAAGGPGTGRARGMLTFKELTAALGEAGLRPGDVVMLHSDIATLGPTEAGFNRDDVLAFYLAAFQKVLTPEGTLAVCTSFEDYARYGTPFVREESPSRLGAFSEYVRTRPGAIRSVHPILSVTCLGKRADEISGGPHHDGFGHDSPWGRLHRLGAKILTLGFDNYPDLGITFVHYVERLFGVPYQYTKLYTTPVYAGGAEVPGLFTLSVRYLDFGITYATRRFRDHLLRAGAARHVPAGRDGLLATSCAALVEQGVECLRTDRYYFLAAPPRFRPGEIPLDGQTGRMAVAVDRGQAPAA